MVDAVDRIRQWQTLLESHRIGRDRGDGYLEVRFRADADAARELDRLVAAECDCCSFVDWSVTPQDGELRLRISGDDAALESFSF